MTGEEALLAELHEVVPQSVRSAIADLMTAVIEAGTLSGLAVEVTLIAADEVQLDITPRLKPTAERIVIQVTDPGDLTRCPEEGG